MEHLARMRTLDAAYEMLKAEDPDTAISKYYLRYLMLSGQIPVIRVGCKRLLNYDALLLFLQNPPEASHDSTFEITRLNKRRIFRLSGVRRFIVLHRQRR